MASRRMHSQAKKHESLFSPYKRTPSKLNENPSNSLDESRGQSDGIMAEGAKDRPEKEFVYTLTFGKHFGKTFPEVEKSGDYRYIIDLLISRIFDKDKDMKKALEIFFDARKRTLQTSRTPAKSTINNNGQEHIIEGQEYVVKDITRPDLKKFLKSVSNDKADPGIRSGSALLSWTPRTPDKIPSIFLEFGSDAAWLWISESDTKIYFCLDMAALCILPIAVWEPKKHWRPRKPLERNPRFWVWQVWHLAAVLHSTAVATQGLRNFFVRLRADLIKEGMKSA